MFLCKTTFMYEFCVQEGEESCKKKANLLQRNNSTMIKTLLGAIAKFVTSVMFFF